MIDQTAGLDGLPCAENRACASSGELSGETCCARGDSLAYIGVGSASEVVDIETDDRLTWLCGGFGVRINDLSDPTKPQAVASATNRCQRIALGPLLDEGDLRIFWLAHHGDSWVRSRFLEAFRIRYSTGEIAQNHSIELDLVLFEGTGAAGVDLFDASRPGELAYLATSATAGSVQAVATEGDILAVAAWNHAAVYDTMSLQLLGTSTRRLRRWTDRTTGIPPTSSLTTKPRSSLPRG